MTDLDLLDLEGRTLYVLTPEGRIARENDPDRSAGPQFWLAGCKSGTVARLHRNLAPDIAAEIEALAAREPPFDEPGALPRFIADYERLLPGATLSRELVHELPHGLAVESAAKLISSRSEEGARFVADIAKHGMPENLAALRMRVPEDLWAPWVMLMVDGEVASTAFAARLSDAGAELGLATVPKFRGRGLARLVTAAWSNLPELKTRRLFYGADHDNLASQRVIAQLGLRRIGVSIRLT
ncbi:GNAT family N-acetyltransferase [Aestuariivirga sp. YIM B02566]|uniref:GNAT family N-acetyltransferase n=1 Tax=Taklimakanibacter albus TaxID=2800327 RepID=A0ACC5RFT3_9HYPH|nr:GNAT family N-acetyltransferase [Aestuariivirga sp. YIM B02566]MBK1871494.1 GNAT family N-acetyltransferase [Aestuariivirga sp. YIM B02566]